MLSIFLIGIALSMDAFSIALSLGLNRASQKRSFLLAIIISIFHFFMPLLGNIIGDEILNIININPRFLIIVIFLYLAILMYLDKDNSKKYVLNVLSLLIIPFSVSIDSFSVGIGLSGLTNHKILSYLLFSVCSGSFTLMGFIIGKYTNKYLKDRAKYIGIFILISLAIVNMCKIIAQ